MADEVEERGLRTKIRNFLDGKYKTPTVIKVVRIMDGFPTVEKFCSAPSSEWLAKYRCVRPNSGHDIGKVCQKAIDDAISFVREDRRVARLEKEAKEKAEQEAIKVAEEAKRKAEAEEMRNNPKFSLGELKSIVAFMELCDIASIDLKQVKNFLSMIDAKVKER